MEATYLLKRGSPVAQSKIERTLLRALKKAFDHLEYCGYGDKWERECAMEEELPKLIEKAIKDAGGGNE